MQFVSTLIESAKDWFKKNRFEDDPGKFVAVLMTEAAKFEQLSGPEKKKVVIDAFSHYLAESNLRSEEVKFWMQTVPGMIDLFVDLYKQRFVIKRCCKSDKLCCILG